MGDSTKSSEILLFPRSRLNEIIFHQGNQLLPACFIFGPSFNSFDDCIYEDRDEGSTWTKLTAIKWSFLLDKLTSRPKCQTGSIGVKQALAFQEISFFFSARQHFNSELYSPKTVSLSCAEAVRKVKNLETNGRIVRVGRSAFIRSSPQALAFQLKKTEDVSQGHYWFPHKMTRKPGHGKVAKYCLLVRFPYSPHLALFSGYKVFKKLARLKIFFHLLLTYIQMIFCQVDWTEHWLIGLITFHALTFLCILTTRKWLHFQVVLFLCLCEY